MARDDTPAPAYTTVIDALGWGLAERYIAGECTPEEQRTVLRWSADPRHAAALAWLKDIRTTSHALAPHRQAPADVSAAWKQLQVAVAKPPLLPVIRPATQPAIRAAFRVLPAVVAVTVMLMLWPSHSSSAVRVIATAAGQRSSLTLRDGTQITLAPSSRLRIHQGDETRNVELEGEAYFAVVHDTQHPFAVHTHGVVVRDVGTVFDVQAYSEDSAIRVAVAEGEVAVNGTPAKAGEIATVVLGSTPMVSQGGVADNMAWVQGRLVFNQTPLPNVLHALERTFDITIRVADTTLIARRTFTASFTTESADQILDAVTQALGARYERSGKAVTIARRPPPPPVRSAGTSLTLKNS